jgi:hypothetical protein
MLTYPRCDICVEALAPVARNGLPLTVTFISATNWPDFDDTGEEENDTESASPSTCANASSASNAATLDDEQTLSMVAIFQMKFV